MSSSVIKAKLVLSRDQLSSSRQDLSISRTEHHDCSETSSKNNSELKQLVSVLKEFVQANKRNSQPTTVPVYAQDLEPRDRPVLIPLPNDYHILSRQSLQKYMTQLCGMVWSRAFHYYSTNQLSFQNTKIYSSQQILQNLARLCEKYTLKAADFNHINHHLQDNVLQYMLNKYPMTLSQEINRNLNNSVREFDDTDNISNNYLYKSNVVFKYRESGEYNDLIMRTINEAINCIQARQNDQSVYEKFEDKMTLLFEKVRNYQWMNKQSQEQEKVSERPDDQHEDGYESHLQLLLTLNNSIQNKVNMNEKNLKNEYMKLKEKEKSKYEDKVKQYTHYKINKKLPESTRPFTQEQINSHRLSIESPQILRILTKWCEELQKKIQCTSYFQHFIEGASLQKSAFLNLMSEVRETLGELIKEQKSKIQRELTQLANNNFYMQSELLMRKMATSQFNQIDRYQRISALFSIGVVNNLHSYIIAYLNRLIHGLLAVFKKFQQLPGFQQLELPTNSSVITFRVMDLVRCKISSKEKEVLKIYNQLMKQCQENENMGLVRVVNRLKKGTNDILINIKYRHVLCQIQLAITNKQSTFLEYSNAFNHYLYQLKRSVFGPLTELSGIWKSLDSRFNFYRNLEVSMVEGPGYAVHACNSDCTQISYNRPFICSLCSHHYFHNKFVKRHIKCRDYDFWRCARCEIKRSNCSDLLTAAFHDQEFVSKCKKTDENSKELPNYGICIYIQSQNIVIEPFRKYTNQKSIEKIIGIKKKNIYQIYDISSEKTRKKFMKKFVIFQVDDDFGIKHIKISNEAVKLYLTEQKFKQLLFKNKDTANLNNEDITNHQLERICKIGKKQQKNRIKSLSLISNKITTCKVIAQQFENLSRLQLSKNRLTNFSDIVKLRKLHKVTVNDNDLKEFPEEICHFKGMKEISLNENSIRAIPPSLKNCDQLMSLNMTSNKLTQIPCFIFQLRDLAEFKASSNFIIQIPQSILLASKLRYLSLQNNYIKRIPQQIEFLSNLQRLNLSYNKISEIPQLTNLQNLKHLNLRQNSISNVDNFFNTVLSLKELDLSYNYIKSLHEVNKFNLLRFLNLAHNDLTIFPIFGPNCSKLKNLILSNNKISKMGSFENLNLLEEVQLSGNMFEEAHPSLFKLQHLSIVHIQNNQIKNFSNLLMEKVSKLFLKCNKITKMKNLHMTFLEELDASENQLAVFELNYLPKLRKVNMNINQLTNLQLSSYPKISVMQAAKNNLTSVPKFHPNNHIKVLSLEHNSIEQISKQILTSNHINILNLSNNKIKVIPRQLENLTTLKSKSLFLQKNPLEVVECINFIDDKCGYDIGTDIKITRSRIKEQTIERISSQTDSLYK